MRNYDCVKRFRRFLEYRRFRYSSKSRFVKNSVMRIALLITNLLSFFIGFSFCFYLDRLGFLK